MRTICLAAVLCTATAPTVARACTVDKGSNEARMLAWFGGPLSFAPLGPSRRLAPGAVVVGGDVTYVPTPSAATSRSSGNCYFRAKSENTGLAPVLPRPRIIIGIGAGVTLEGMYLPPVTVADATPNLGSLALAWTTPLGAASRSVLLMTWRAHATFGQVAGPIICSRRALQKTAPGEPCFSSTPSKDTYRPHLVGAEVGVSTAFAGPLNWYGGLAYTSLKPRLEVDFTDDVLGPDHTIVEVDLTRIGVFGGLGYALTKSVELTAQVYSVPQDATTARAGLSWRLR